jgi:hypothetical protein
MRKNAKQFIAITCAGCKTKFSKEKKEYDRQVKYGRTKFYCTLPCARHYDPLDRFSDFRVLLSSARKRSRNHALEFRLSLRYLKRLWDTQSGRCPYTGINMILNKTKSPEAASLDRIDSTRGYCRGNVEFVCLFINYGKNGFTKEAVKEFLGKWQTGNAPALQAG